MGDDEKTEGWQQWQQQCKRLARRARVEHQRPRKSIEIDRAPRLESEPDYFKPRRALSLVPEASCDLHGLTLQQAYVQCVAFIERSLENQYQLVRIITGKGEGDQETLYSQVPRWLQEKKHFPGVIKLSRADKRYGGKGALDVWLHVPKE